MVEVTWILLGSLGFLLWYIYSRVCAIYRHWEEVGVPYEKPLFLLGCNLPLVLLRKSKVELYRSLYKKYEGRPYFGYFEFLTPLLMVRDPELIGKILVKDFGHFVDHGLEFDEENHWIDLNLFNLNGSRWRAVRQKISPAFTSGKLKGMYPQMVESTEAMIQRIKDSKGRDVDAKSEIALYTSEVIASCAFGLDGTRNDPQFREMGCKALDFDTPRYLGFLLQFGMPWLAKKLGIAFTPHDVARYFAKIIKDTFDYRIKNNVSRNDFVQLLLQLKEKGKVEIQTKDADDDYLDMGMSPTTETIVLTEKMLIAQAFTFIMAGFEALSSTVTFAIAEFGIRPEMQERARREVRESVAKHGGFTYQALKEMTYLEMFVQETMRIHPLVTFLMRQVTKDYPLEDGTVLRAGTKVVIPNLAVQSDPAHWPNPEQFLPERFSPEAHRVPYSFLPFGDGPRVCIGMRFAMLQIKQALASVIYNFKMELSPKTTFPLKLKKAAIITSTVDPVWIRFTPVNA